MPAIETIIAEYKRHGQRERELPPSVMVFFVIALSLFPDA